MGAEALSPNTVESVAARHSVPAFTAWRTLGIKHGFAATLEIPNGDGKYLLHIKQRHNETTETGLLRVDPTILSIQISIEGLLRDFRREYGSGTAPLPVFSEGNIGQVLDFGPIRDTIAQLQQRAGHADELFKLLSEYYDKTFLRRLESLKIPELAQINFLIAEALKPSEKRPDFLCVDGISSGDSTPDELALMAGGAMKLHALGEVMLLPAEGQEEISSALALVYKEGRDFFDVLAGAILQWTPPAEHAELLELLGYARSVHRYQLFLSRLDAYAVTMAQTRLLDQFRERAHRVSESVFIVRERKAVERLALFLAQSPAKVAPLVFGVDHNFVRAVTEWNSTSGIRLGLVTYTHHTEIEARKSGSSGLPGAAHKAYCAG